MLGLMKPPELLEINADGFCASGANIFIRLSDTTVQKQDLPWQHRKDGSLGASNGRLSIEISLDQDRTLLVNVKNSAPEPVRVHEIIIEFPPASFKTPLQAREHRQLIQPQTLSAVQGVKAVHMPTEWAEVNPESSMVTVYSHFQTRQALLIGVLPPFGCGYAWISTLHDSLHMEGCFGVKIRFDVQRVLAPGELAATSPLVMLSGHNGVELLEKYGNMIDRRAKRRRKSSATGWNSWDYYAGAVTRNDMDKNIAACRKILGDQIRYIVIDEGWEYKWGMWEANIKFPQGLEDFCRHVKQAGYSPGIWTAPLLVDSSTPLFRDSPEWFAGDSDGNVYLCNLSYGQMAILDITLTEVQSYLREVYTGLRKSGFEYFKVDFTQLALDAHNFNDVHVGRAELIRAVFQLIRDCIGDDAYLLSSGGPLESVIGIADAYRATADIHNFWGQIAQNIRALFTRCWLQEGVINIDPDFLIVRCDETSDDPWRNRRLPLLSRNMGVHWLNGREMNLEEAKALALAIYMMGGEVILGDALGKLNEDGIEILKKIIAPCNMPAKPLNLFEPDAEIAPIMFSQTDREYILACFNLSDNPYTVRSQLDFLKNSVCAKEFWTGEPVDINRQFKIKLGPRSAKGFRIYRSS